MTSENYQTDHSKISPTNVDVPGQMRGWFKLIETIRSTDPPVNSSNEHSQSPSSTHTNDYQSPSPEPLLPPPPPPPPPLPKRRSTRHKKITIRKSIKSKDSLSDIEQKRSSIDLSNSVPFATDLESLPGNSIDENRDQRFLDYTDLNTLATHFQSCLHIDKKSFANIHFPKQYIFKTRHNILNKIFKLSFLKTWKSDDIDLCQSSEVSATSMSFPTDWSVNRRSSSSKPKNIFHILQLHPKKTLLSQSTKLATTSKNLSIDEQFQQDYEHMKDLLIRTYYPHFHRTVQSKIYFGAKLKSQSNTIEQIDIKKSDSPPQSLPIVKRHSNKRERQTTDEFLSIKIKQRRVSEEIPSPKRKISYSDSEDDDDDLLLPDELPQPIIIKNGLRSNYYKTTSKSIRRSRHFSGSLPPFYTGLFENDDKNLSYINYQLPYDIYWFSQKNPRKKKIISFEELTIDEKQLIQQTSIFLPRNLRRIQFKHKQNPNKKHSKNEHNNEQFPILIFPQKFYHSKSINNFQLSHRDLLNLFYNHIRRSHFAKINRYEFELIDSTSIYAQLGQLTLILNRFLNLILNYKCQKTDIYPSNALKKCPQKRLFPMYYELISKPIDLTLIRKKLDQGDYLSYDSFEEDLLLLFRNAITYCGENSDVGRAVSELHIYFLKQIRDQYQSTIDLFRNLPKEIPNERNIRLFEEFIRRFHQSEVHHGLIRQTLAEIIFQIDENPTPKILKTPYIIHCQCGSYFDETTLVQCYACQLWQHVSCVRIEDTSRPYYCFECNSNCEENSLNCLKTNVRIQQQQGDEQFYSTITRSDGLMIRINECYLIENHSSKIFSIERLWFDKYNRGFATGLFYLKSEQIQSENQRKFYPNEVFRLSSTNESISIDDILRPCYILDQTTFCKGKPIAEYSSRLIDKELFICEYRLEKNAKTFTRLNKSKQLPIINTKFYCFDNFIEKLTIKRESQSNELFNRRSNKISAKEFDEKSFRIDGLIEKIYCRFHHPNLMPTDTNFSADFFYKNEQDTIRQRSSKRQRTQPPLPPTNRKQSLPDILRSIIDQIIDTISSQ